MDSDRVDGQPAKFSTPLTAMLVHRLRSLHDAILVGSGTALADNPRLDCRLWPGRSPRPVVIDRRGRLDEASLRMSNPIILTDGDDLEPNLKTLYSKGITSVLVEGGAELLQSFINSGLWDAARIETAPFTLGSHGRVAAPQIVRHPDRTETIGGNKIEYYNN